MKLREIAEIKMGYSLRREGAQASGDIFFVQPKDINSSYRIDISEVSKIDIANYERQIIELNEVLLISRGRFAAIVFDKSYKGKFVVSSLLLRIKVCDDSIMPEYIALYLNSPLGQKELKRVSGSIMMPSITKSQLEELEIPLISISRQKKLINLSCEFNRWRDLHHKQFELQQTLINSVISKETGAING